MKKWVKRMGILTFLVTLVFFCLQVCSLIVQYIYQAEYIDDRLFYLFNMVIVTFLGISIFLMISLNKKFITLITSIIVILISINVYLMYERNQEIKNITNLSPNGKEVFAIKKKRETGEATYYRSYFKLFGRPHQEVPDAIDRVGNLKWLTDDIAVLTYMDKNQDIQQFVGTYGDRRWYVLLLCQ